MLLEISIFLHQPHKSLLSPSLPFMGKGTQKVFTVTSSSFLRNLILLPPGLGAGSCLETVLV